MAGKVLLVEGVGDRDFIRAVLESANLRDVGIEPKTPRQADGSIQRDGVDNLLKVLALELKKLKEEDGIDRLGIIVDADHPTEDASCNFGFSVRRKQVAEVLAKEGWQTATSLTKGELFHHPDKLPDVGLWVMPDHSANGMLEDFIAPLVVGAGQQQLFEHARTTIDELPIFLFNKPLHTTKAHVATWRAWQKSPGASLGKALQNGALDLSRSPASDFIRWLKGTFG